MKIGRGLLKAAALVKETGEMFSVGWAGESREDYERRKWAEEDQQWVRGMVARREPQVGAEADRLAAGLGLPALGMAWLGAEKRAAAEQWLQMPLVGNGRDEEDWCYARLDELIAEHSADMPEPLVLNLWREDIQLQRFAPATEAGVKLLRWRLVFLEQRRQAAVAAEKAARTAAWRERMNEEKPGALWR